MTNTPTRRLVLSLCFFAFLVAIAASERPTFAQCAKVADSEIVSTIYGRIKSNKGLAAQISHINVISVNQAVKFQGWAMDKDDYDSIVGIGMSTDCVRLVNVNSFNDAPPTDGAGSLRGCSAGTKACGDICIPEGDVCNITGLRGYYKATEPFELSGGFNIFQAVLACW